MTFGQSSLDYSQFTRARVGKRARAERAEGQDAWDGGMDQGWESERQSVRAEGGREI